MDTFIELGVPVPSKSQILEYLFKLVYSYIIDWKTYQD